MSCCRLLRPPTPPNTTKTLKATSLTLAATTDASHSAEGADWVQPSRGQDVGVTLVVMVVVVVVVVRPWW